MLIAVLALLVVAAFVLKELIAVRRQVSSIRQSLEWLRQSLEWWVVGYLETRKDSLPPAVREYVEKAKQDLIREGVHEGTLTEQQIHELFQKADQGNEMEPESRVFGIGGPEYRVETRRGDHWMSVWRGFSYDQAVRICRWGQKEEREMRIV
jgi:hypothetical protein